MAPATTKLPPAAPQINPHARQPTSAAGVTYTYDGDGLRVEKSSGTLYWRSYTGQVLEETNTSGAMTSDYIFFAGRRIAWRDSSGNVHYDFVDLIGSTRAVTNSTGSVCFSADYYPFGQENDYTTSCTPTHKFAGYEYDSEMGNYYAMARYYDPRLGRFMSPDPLGGAVGDPQSLNRYTYVLNNPETFVDPWGLCGQPTTYQYAYTPKQGTYAVLYVDPSCNPAGPPIGIWWSGEGAMPYAPLLGPPSFKPGGVFPHVGAQPQTQVPAQKKGFFTCASDAAESVSIAADLHKIPGLKSGPGGFIVNAVAGNPFSGLTDLVASFNTGEAGGHNVFYHMALASTAGPALGFSSVLPKAAEGTPWAISPVDVAFSGLLGEYATGVGEANLAFSAITYGASAVGCYAGWIQ